MGPRSRPVLTPEKRRLVATAAARRVLEPPWREICAIFEAAGYDAPGRAKFTVTTDVREGCRHFAATTGDEVMFAPQMVDLPFDSCAGIMAHEAGHVVDLTAPCRYWWQGGELVEAHVVDPPSRLIGRWNARPHDDVERIADAIAMMVVGVKIGYVGSPGCVVQALGRGRRRPKDLR